MVDNKVDLIIIGAGPNGLSLGATTNNGSMARLRVSNCLASWSGCSMASFDRLITYCEYD